MNDERLRHMRAVGLTVIQLAVLVVTSGVLASSIFYRPLGDAVARPVAIMFGINLGLLFWRGIMSLTSGHRSRGRG